MIFVLAGLLASSLFSLSIDYNNYFHQWYESRSYNGSDPASRLIFYVIKGTNLPIETFIILPYCLLCYMVRKNHLHLMITILFSYSVMFNSLITVRVFFAAMLFMIAILLVFKKSKISFITSITSLSMAFFSILFHLSMALFIPIYLVALISWTRTAFILASIFSMSLVAIFFSAFGQSLLQPFLFRFEYADFGTSGLTFAQLGHLILLILEMQIMRIHLYKHKEKVIFILLAYGLIIFLTSIMFHSLLVSRVMHIYHLISLILIMRYTAGNSFLIKTYLAVQIFMSIYILNFSQIYFPGISDSYLILIFSALVFYYIAVHELLLHFIRVKNRAK
jgi:hypothetical protein